MPLRPLQVLCEAKVSAASPAFIKCSCDSCVAGSSSGGCNFNSVREYAEHTRQVFGPDTVVVEAQSELSWQVRMASYGFAAWLLGFFCSTALQARADIQRHVRSCPEEVSRSTV
jgi:hypothetical protein